LQHLLSVAIRREHGVRDLFDHAVALNPGESSDEYLPGHGERWQAHRGRERQLRVAQDREGEMQTLGELTLVLGVLRAEPEDARVERGEIGGQVAERARLRGAAARSRD